MAEHQQKKKKKLLRKIPSAEGVEEVGAGGNWAESQPNLTARIGEIKKKA